MSERKEESGYPRSLRRSLDFGSVLLLETILIPGLYFLNDPFNLGINGKQIDPLSFSQALVSQALIYMALPVLFWIWLGIPHVKVGPHECMVVNPIRTYTFPFTAVERVAEGLEYPKVWIRGLGRIYVLGSRLDDFSMSVRPVPYTSGLSSQVATVPMTRFTNHFSTIFVAVAWLVTAVVSIVIKIV